MSLPSAWIDKIFRKLTLAYGRDFLGRWEGIELNDVKSDWAHELSGLEDAPEAIAHALANLPSSRPPTVYEFRDVCRKAPVKKPLQLEAVKADPERVAAELRKLAPMRQQASDVDRKQWARDWIARHERGEKVAPYTLNLARKALKLHLMPGDAHA